MMCRRRFESQTTVLGRLTKTVLYISRHGMDIGWCTILGYITYRTSGSKNVYVALCHTRDNRLGIQGALINSQRYLMMSRRRFESRTTVPGSLLKTLLYICRQGMGIRWCTIFGYITYRTSRSKNVYVALCHTRDDELGIKGF